MYFALDFLYTCRYLAIVANNTRRNLLINLYHVFDRGLLNILHENPFSNYSIKNSIFAIQLNISTLGDLVISRIMYPQTTINISL